MILGRSVNQGRGLLLNVVLILVVSDGAQANPPLETETARLLKQGQLETDAAAEYQSSSEGSEVAIPLEFEYGITVVLASILPKHGSSTTGIGDLEITTFGYLVNEREYVPAIAIAGEVLTELARLRQSSALTGSAICLEWRDHNLPFTR